MGCSVIVEALERLRKRVERISESEQKKSFLEILELFERHYSVLI